MGSNCDLTFRGHVMELQVSKNNDPVIPSPESWVDQNFISWKAKFQIENSTILEILGE